MPQVHNSDGLFNFGHMCLSRIKNHGDIGVGHDVLKAVKFRVKIEFINFKICLVADAESLMKGFTKSGLFTIIDTGDGHKIDVFGNGQKENDALDAHQIS